MIVEMLIVLNLITVNPKLISRNYEGTVKLYIVDDNKMMIDVNGVKTEFTNWLQPISMENPNVMIHDLKGKYVVITEHVSGGTGIQKDYFKVFDIANKKWLPVKDLNRDRDLVTVKDNIIIKEYFMDDNGQVVVEYDIRDGIVVPVKINYEFGDKY